MAMRSLVGKLRFPASFQRVAGSGRVGARVASQDKMSSRAFSKTPADWAEGYDERLRSFFEKLEKEQRRQRRSMWKAVLRAEAAALAIAFGGLCYIADNNRVELPEAGTNHPD